jgi:hypothetical protein
MFWGCWASLLVTTITQVSAELREGFKQKIGYDEEKRAVVRARLFSRPELISCVLTRQQAAENFLHEGHGFSRAVEHGTDRASR